MGGILVNRVARRACNGMKGLDKGDSSGVGGCEGPREAGMAGGAGDLAENG